MAQRPPPPAGYPMMPPPGAPGGPPPNWRPPYPGGPPYRPPPGTMQRPPGAYPPPPGGYRPGGPRPPPPPPGAYPPPGTVRGPPPPPGGQLYAQAPRPQYGRAPPGTSGSQSNLNLAQAAPPQTGSVATMQRGTSASMNRSMMASQRSVGGLSQSLGAAKASMVSVGSTKTTIQQEYHDIKVQRKMRSIWYGKGKYPFKIGLAAFGLAFLFFSIGLILILLRFHQMIFLGVYTSEFVGPAFLGLSMLALAISCKFIWDAYKLSNLERARLRFHAVSESQVSVHTVNPAEALRIHEDKPITDSELKSGTMSRNAIARTPIGSKATLSG